jgi:hypothetical protein
VESIGPAAAQEFSLLPAENTSGVRPPHRISTGVGVTELGVPGALLELSAVAVARD